MEDSRDPQVWADAEARADPHRHDVESAKVVYNFISTWAPVDGFDGTGGIHAMAAFLASAAVFHHDRTIWEIFTKRRFEVLDNRLLVPLHAGVESSDARLTAILKHAALVSLSQRADESLLTHRWFEELDVICAIPPLQHGQLPSLSDISDALIATLVQGNHIAEHKIADDAPERALKKLASIGSVPTIDSWCVLAMADSDRWMPVVSLALTSLKVPRPLPSQFIERIGIDQFSPQYVVHFRKAIGRLGKNQ